MHSLRRLINNCRAAHRRVALAESGLLNGSYSLSSELWEAARPLVLIHRDLPGGISHAHENQNAKFAHTKGGIHPIN